MQAVQRLFTLGYIHRKIEDFIRLIEDYEIDLVADIRLQNTSQNKPEYSGESLKKSLKKIGCSYFHCPEFAVPYPILDAYRARVFDNSTFVRYLHWRYSAAVDYVTQERICSMEKLIRALSEYEKPCILGMLPHASPDSKQRMICHRLILASSLYDSGACREVIHI